MSKTTWKIDPMHSEIQFKVKHMMISNVTGSFTEFESTLKHEGDDFSDAEISFQANINSIDTGNEQRDGHLKSPEFFDVGQFPQLSFKSTSVKKDSADSKYTVQGDLTIKGVTRPVTLQANFGGMDKDSYGRIKAGFELTGAIKRKDFGLTWDGVTEAGNVMLSDEIKLMADVQFVKEAEAVTAA